MSKGRTAFESLTLLLYDGFERRPSPNRRSAKVGGIPDDAPDPVTGLDERVVRREDIRSASLGWRWPESRRREGACSSGSVKDDRPARLWGHTR
jgi:hypothetical protein